MAELKTLSQRIAEHGIWSLSPDEISAYRQEVREGKAEEWRASASYVNQDGDVVRFDVTGVTEGHCALKLGEGVQARGRVVVFNRPTKFIPSGI